MTAIKHHLYANLDPLAHHFAVFICQMAGSRKRSLYLAALAVSLESSRQNTCADLSLLATQKVSENSPLKYPELKHWLQDLGLFSNVIGTAADNQNKPLILEGSKLYLQRYWQHEQRLAQWVVERSRIELESANSKVFQRFFSSSSLDWQALACANVLFNQLSIISGGPGTGKTTTIAKLLAILVASQPEIKIALAAPTGKAAMRMKQALENNLKALSLPVELQPKIDVLLEQSASTIHRLLGSLPGKISFRHNQKNPLPWDLVIVDEASMIDLGMMRRLLEAISPQAKLVLLGDPFQLTSVETGSVLGDICQSANALAYTPARQKQLSCLTGMGKELLSTALQTSNNPFDNVVTELKVSHRFKAGSAIDLLAKAVNTGQAKEALEILRMTDSPAQLVSKTQSLNPMIRLTQTVYLKYFSSNSPQEALQAYEQMIFLSAFRRGPWGVEGINQSLEHAFQRQGWIKPQHNWYHLRPIIIMENDYTHHLYNGDIGICWQENERSRIWFQRSDGSYRSFSASQLGQHETAWALTVHKSQGSEFHHVVLVLPDVIHPLLSRELIYTAITRAREKIMIYGNTDVLSAGIQHRVERKSGLKTRLLDLM